MADYFPAHIEIGGELPSPLLDEFLTAINQSGAHLDYGEYANLGAVDLLVFVHAGRPVELMSDQARYGWFEDLETFCQEHGLTYRRQSDAAYEFDAHQVFWLPGLAEPVELAADSSGNVYISERQLQEFAGQGKTIADVIAWLESRKGPTEIPPLVLTL